MFNYTDTVFKIINVTNIIFRFFYLFKRDFYINVLIYNKSYGMKTSQLLLKTLIMSEIKIESTLFNSLSDELMSTLFTGNLERIK